MPISENSNSGTPQDVLRKTKSSVDKDRDRDRIPGRLWQHGLLQPLNHVLETPGKRLRAELIELSFRMAGGTGEVPLDLIEFVELLHAGSLVIDDIQDDSQSRRNKPTLHTVSGIPIAINTGNWMYFSALEKLQDLPLPPERLFGILSESISIIRRGHEGQALDLTANVTELDRLAIFPTVRTISKLKTGNVTALAAKLGAAVAGADQTVQIAFFGFGMQLGIGLQMQNDTVELKGAAKYGGRNDDLKNARVTWPWAWASRLVSPADFVFLQNALVKSTRQNIHEVASALLESIARVCQRSVSRKLDGAIGCLAKVGLEDHPALKQLTSRIEGYYV